MDDPAGMRGREGPGDVGRDPRGLARRQGAAAPRMVARSSPSTSSMTMNGPDGSWPKSNTATMFGMVQRRGGLRLLAEAGREVGVAPVLGSEELDGDVAVELGCPGPVDGRHAALAEQLDQAVATAQDRADLRQAVVPLVTRRATVRRSRSRRGIVPPTAARRPSAATVRARGPAGTRGTRGRGPAARARARPTPGASPSSVPAS